MRKWALVFTILSVLLPGFAAGLAGCSPERLNDGLDDDSDTDGGTMLPPGTQTCRPVIHTSRDASFHSIFWSDFRNAGE